MFFFTLAHIAFLNFFFIIWNMCAECQGDHFEENNVLFIVHFCLGKYIFNFVPFLSTLLTGKLID